MERPGWRWTSDTIAAVIYSVLVTFLMLSWAYFRRELDYLAPFQSVMSATLACHAHLDIGGGASRSSACEPCSTRFERRRCSPSPRRRRARWRFLADPRAASSSSCAKCLRSLLIDAFARARVLDQATNIRLRQTKARCVVNNLALLGRGLERRPHCITERRRPPRAGWPPRAGAA
jgi:hypothetical protein